MAVACPCWRWCLSQASTWLVCKSGLNMVGVQVRPQHGWCASQASTWLVCKSGLNMVGVCALRACVREGWNFEGVSHDVGGLIFLMHDV
eukprot:1160751-Pelagomonas_calceolata.AAC.6